VVQVAFPLFTGTEIPLEASKQLMYPKVELGPLSVNVMRPVAVDGEIVAMNVTGCPDTEGLGLDVSVTVVGALFTICTRVEEMAPPVFVSPL